MLDLSCPTVGSWAGLAQDRGLAGAVSALTAAELMQLETWDGIRGNGRGRWRHEWTWFLSDLLILTGVRF